MPDVGRFFNIDPLSEKYAYQSHYNFSENRVVNSREIEGLEAEDNYETQTNHEALMREFGRDLGTQTESVRESSDLLDILTFQWGVDISLSFGSGGDNDGHWVGSNGELLHDDGIDDNKLYYVQDGNDIKNGILVAENGNIVDTKNFTEMLLGMANELDLNLTRDNVEIFDGKGGFLFDSEGEQGRYFIDKNNNRFIAPFKGHDPYLKVSLTRKGNEPVKTYYNLLNTLEHERNHFNDINSLPDTPSRENAIPSSEFLKNYRKNSERNSVKYQMRQNSWQCTTEAYKIFIQNYYND